MRKYAWFFIGYTCVFGAAGTFVRWLQGLVVPEVDTGLYTPGSGLSVCLVLVCLAFAVGLFILALRLRRYAAYPDYASALNGHTIAVPVLGCAFALITAVGGILLLAGASGTAFPVLTRILGILVLATAVSLPVLAGAIPASKSGEGMIRLCTFVPTAMFCFFLIVAYKEESSNPIIWAIAFEFLAIAACTLAYYYLAGYAFGRPRPRHCAFFCCLAAFFCLITLADSMPLAYQLIFTGCGGMLALSAWSIVRNLQERA